MKKIKVGVVIGRFQAGHPHSGHIKVIGTAMGECDEVIIGVGTTVVRKPSDPLPYHLRKMILKSKFRGADVISVMDNKDDDIWFNQIITAVDAIHGSNTEIIFYGSRDSALEYIPSSYQTRKVDPIPDLSATQKREEIKYKDSVDFREGYIKAVQDEYPAIFAVADLLVYKFDDDQIQVLLGYKVKTGEWVLPGGYMDDSDRDLRSAAVREGHEEAGLSINKIDLKYLSEGRCNIWNYAGYRQPVTVAYSVQYKEDHGEPKAGDDLDEVRWFEIGAASSIVGPSGHASFIDQLSSFLQDENI